MRLLRLAAPPLLGILLALLLASLGQLPLRSADTYFHLRFGQEFVGGWSIAEPGHVTAGASNAWAPTQWLPQIGLYLVADAWGRRGLALLFGTLLGLLAGVLYLLLRSRSGPLLALVLTALVLMGTQAHLSLRPQVLSFLFVVATLASWDAARRTGKPPWWLVPLGLLWATCHGMWILGVVISMALAIGTALDTRARGVRAVAFLAVPAGMLAAACLTPVGPRLVGGVLLVNSRSEYFEEWAAPQLVSVEGAPVTVLLAAAVLLLVLKSRVSPYEVALLALGGVFSVYSERTLPLALIVLATLVAGGVQRIGENRLGERPRVARLEVATVVALSLGCATLSCLQPDRILGGAADDLTAVRPVIDTLPDDGVVLTNREYGAVLLWLEPELDIPVHGYGDVYTDAELAAYDDMAKLMPSWDRTVRALGVDAAVLPTDEALAYALLQQGWSEVGRADDVIVLRPPAGWSGGRGGG